MSAQDDIDDPAKFGIHDGYRVREYPLTSGGPWISGYQRLCDACSHEHRHGQPSRHNTAPGTRCESPRHESNVLLANSGAQEPTEYDQYHAHPDVRGWAKDDFSGRGNDVTLCSSCAEDKRSGGHDMEPYYPITENRLMPGDTCTDCGHDLHAGRKEASMTSRDRIDRMRDRIGRTAISAEDERRLTDLPPLDLSKAERPQCTRCRATLAPGESGLCPLCSGDGGGGSKNRNRQKQKLVQTRGGGTERSSSLHQPMQPMQPLEPMLRVLAGIWDDAQPQQGKHIYHGDDEECPTRGSSEWRGADACPGHWHPAAGGSMTNTHGQARDKYDKYRGRKNYVPIANNTWLWKDDAGNHHVRHHETDIMSFSPEGHVTVNPSGWNSTTTRKRINDFLPNGYGLRSNPSRARGAPRQLLSTPTGSHPFEDGISFDTRTHERVENDKVRPTSEAVNPPHVRGGGDASEPVPHSNWGNQSWNPPSGYGSGSPEPSRRYNPNDSMYDPHSPHFAPSGRPGISPVVPRSQYPINPMHEQESTHEQISRQLRDEDEYSPSPQEYGDNVSMQFSHHDMPGEGESFNDWMDRTTEAPKHVPCPTCKGKGDVRGKGPVPAGVNPWEHRDPCPNCEGHGLVKASLRRTAGLSQNHLETWSRWYAYGLRQLAYGMETAPRNTREATSAMPAPPGHALPSRAPTSLAEPRRNRTKHTGFGETKAPAQVDTLRDENCPVCGEHDAYDGDQCQVCGYITPPRMFRDPDLDQAKQMDLRANPATGDPNDQNPNVGANLPPVDEEAVDEEGNVEGEDGNPFGAENGEEDGVVEGEARGLGDEGSEQEQAENQTGDQAEGAEGEPVDEDDVDEDGNVGGPEDEEAATGHVDQGGEPFNSGPNAPRPGQPMDQEAGPDEEQMNEGVEGGEEADGQEVEQGQQPPGTPGDQTPDLLCPACGFESVAATPTSTPGSVTEPSDEGDGMLEGDVCPQCQKATLMGIGEVAQMAGQA